MNGQTDPPVGVVEDVARDLSDELPDGATASVTEGSYVPDEPEWAPVDPYERREALLARILSLAVVAACCIYVFWVVHPELVFADTTPTGGDMGSHVWGPAFLRDHLLPQWRLTGWSPDWYAGFPAYTFYMVPPSLAIVLLDVGWIQVDDPLGAVSAVFIVAAAVAGAIAARRLTSPLIRVAAWAACVVIPLVSISIPYNVAFKLVAVSGIVTMPAAVWVALRGLSLRRPGPELGAVASVFFLMDKTLFHIYGGNIASTMAGEFAFSISLTLSLLAIGVVARGTATGRHRALAAGLAALAALCHVIPAFFAAVGILVIIALRPTKRTLGFALMTGPVALALTAWWFVPFFGNRRYLNDMGWERLGVSRNEKGVNEVDWAQMKRFLLPFGPHQINGVDYPDPNMWGGRVFFVLAVVGAVLSLGMLVRAGIWLTIVTAVAGVAFVTMPQGRFWNARVLPFYYLGIYLLAAVGVYLVIRAAAMVLSGRWIDVPPWASWVAAPLAFLVMWVSIGMTLRQLPGGRLVAGVTETGQAYQWGPFESTYQGVVRGWAKWNFEGLERKPGLDEGSGETNTADSDEFFKLVDEMDRIGSEEGCGQAYWEYDNTVLAKYGTPMAPMMIPYFTDSCVGSMEGLYFEASSTTPYHFIVQSELSQSPSRPQRFDENLGFDTSPYPAFDIETGVEHLRMLGVKYFMAATDETKAAARDDDRLRRVGGSDPWVVYEVLDIDKVVPLENLPVVWDNVDGDIYSWARPAVDWFLNEDVWDVRPANDGPASWPRASADPDAEPGLAHGRLPREESPSPDLTVSNVKTEIDSRHRNEISFEVSEVGSPVLIRTSYFPNWEADGAEGPYRVAPNQMVVVPTERKVTLTYGRSGLEWSSGLVSLAGLVGLVGLVAYRPRRPEDSPFEFFGDRRPTHTEEFWAASQRVDDPTVHPDPPDDADAAGDSDPLGDSDAAGDAEPTDDIEPGVDAEPGTQPDEGAPSP